MIETAVEHALTIEDKRQRYEHVYDALCDYLDKQFQENNYCDFVENQCVAIREDVKDKFTKVAKQANLGCCCSYGVGFGLRIANLKPCIYLGDKQCNTKCVSCKLYVCKYLREKKGIDFHISDFPELKEVFSKKQLEVLSNNPFCSMEEIIEKLLQVEKSRLPFWWFWLNGRAIIKKQGMDD